MLPCRQNPVSVYSHNASPLHPVGPPETDTATLNLHLNSSPSSLYALAIMSWESGNQNVEKRDIEKGSGSETDTTSSFVSFPWVVNKMTILID